MAKQSGIHQLHGKVGEMSYYRQSGVSGGLVRAINQAMSERVKKGEEYANVRLNNAEFGHACRIAGSLGHSIVPKWRPMILPFSQSKLAKDVLKLIKLDKTSGSTWGTRSITQADVQSCLDSLNTLAKNPFNRYFTEVEITDAATDMPARKALAIELYKNADIKAYLNSIDASKLRIYVNIYDFKVGRYDASAKSFGEVQCIQLGQSTVDLTDDAGTYSIEELTYRASYQDPTPTEIGGLLIDFVAVPLRNVNGNDFELQEFASFSNYLHLPA